MDSEKKNEANELIRAVFNQISLDYNEVYLQGLEARMFGLVTWNHLTQFLPEDRNASILDAGGGTGRWTVPLAKMGYRMVLCDLSAGMLAQAEKTLRQEGLLDRVEIREEDITCLPFEDERFDFVMCQDGPFSITPDSEKAAKELVRVLKRKGVIWTGGVGRYPLVLREIRTNPELALQLARSERHYVDYKGTPCRVFTPREIEELFLKNGVTIERIYGYRIITQAFPPDFEIREGRMVRVGDPCEESLIHQAAQIEALLSEDPSLLGIAEYIQLVGRKVADIHH